MIEEKKPVLIMMIGIVGSGKSEKAKELSKMFNATIISSDEIRKHYFNDETDQTHNNEVFNILHEKIIDELKLQHSVIYDATNISLKHRIAFVNFLKNRNVFYNIELCAYIMTTSVEVCKQQNNSRNRVVPEEVIDRQVAKYEIPFFCEGFSHIWLQNYLEPNCKDKKHFDWINRLKVKNMMKFPQDNPHHDYDCLTHCKKTKQQILKQKVTEYITPIMIEAALFHDIGKLFTKKWDDTHSYAHYYNHASVGTYFLLQNLNIFKVKTYKEVLEILFLINYHMRPFNWNDGPNLSQRAKFGIINCYSLFYLHRADILSCKKGGDDDEA